MKSDKAIEVGLESAVSQGAQSAEAYFVEQDSLIIEVHGGKLETMNQSRDRGLGLRVIKNGTVGYAFTSELSPQTIRQTAAAAVQSTLYLSLDRAAIFPASSSHDSSLAHFDHELEKTPIRNKLDLALAIENAALAADKRIIKTERAGYEENSQTVTIANTNDLYARYKTNYCGGYAWVLAEDNGDTQTGSGLIYANKLSEIDPKTIGNEASTDAVQLLGAKPIPSQKLPLVLPPKVAIQFLEILISAFTAEAVQKGRSLFANQIGETIATPKVTIIDDGTLPNGINTAPVDGEGVPHQRTVLMENGILKTFLHNTYTGIKDDVPSTGNGVRTSFKSTPEIGPTNIFFAPGEKHEFELVQNVAKGLYVSDLMGTHMANPVSGDFSLGVTGLLIENGRFTQPVRQVVLAGNLRDLLNQVQDVGSDLRFYLGLGAPTMLVDPLTISG